MATRTCIAVMSARSWHKAELEQEPLEAVRKTTSPLGAEICFFGGWGQVKSHDDEDEIDVV